MVFFPALLALMAAACVGRADRSGAEARGFFDEAERYLGIDNDLALALANHAYDLDPSVASGHRLAGFLNRIRRRLVVLPGQGVERPTPVALGTSMVVESVGVLFPDGSSQLLEIDELAMNDSPLVTPELVEPFGSSGKLAISKCCGRRAVYRVEQMREIGVIGDEGRTTSVVSISDDDHYIVAVSGGVEILYEMSDAEIVEIGRRIPAGEEWYLDLVFVSESTLLSVDSGGVVELLNLDFEVEWSTKLKQDHIYGVDEISVSESGSFYIVSTINGQVYVLENDGDVLYNFRSEVTPRVLYSGWGQAEGVETEQILFVSGNDIVAADLNSGETLYNFPADGVRAILLFPDRDDVFVSVGAYSASIRRLGSGHNGMNLGLPETLGVELLRSDTGDSVSPLMTPSVKSRIQISDAALGSNGTSLYLVGDNGKFAVIDLTTDLAWLEQNFPEVEFTWQDSRPWSIELSEAMSPSGFPVDVASGVQVLKFGEGSSRFVTGGTIAVERSTDGLGVTVAGQQFDINAPFGTRFERFAVSPSADFLATSGTDGIVTIWNLNDGTFVLNVPDWNDPAVFLQFTADGSALIAVGLDGSANRWPVSWNSEWDSERIDFNWLDGRSLQSGDEPLDGNAQLVSSWTDFDGGKMLLGFADGRVLTAGSDGFRLSESLCYGRVSVISSEVPSSEEFAVGCLDGAAWILGVDDFERRWVRRFDETVLGVASRSDGTVFVSLVSFVAAAHRESFAWFPLYGAMSGVLTLSEDETVLKTFASQSFSWLRLAPLVQATTAQQIVESRGGRRDLYPEEYLATFLVAQ